MGVPAGYTALDQVQSAGRYATTTPCPPGGQKRSAVSQARAILVSTAGRDALNNGGLLGSRVWWGVCSLPGPSSNLRWKLRRRTASGVNLHLKGNSPVLTVAGVVP